MASENRTMRGPLIKALRTIDARPVENPADPGTPDIWTQCGWIELKELDAWPVRDATPVRVSHYRAEQKTWARRAAFRGTACYLLLKIKRDWLLFNGAWAAENLGTLPQNDLWNDAVVSWKNGLNKEELLKWLQQHHRDSMSPNSPLASGSSSGDIAKALTSSKQRG